jgi:hypothetical protein
MTNLRTLIAAVEWHLEDQFWAKNGHFCGSNHERQLCCARAALWPKYPITLESRRKRDPKWALGGISLNENDPFVTFF